MALMLMGQKPNQIEANFSKCLTWKKFREELQSKFSICIVTIGNIKQAKVHHVDHSTVTMVVRTMDLKVGIDIPVRDEEPMPHMFVTCANTRRG